MPLPSKKTGNFRTQLRTQPSGLSMLAVVGYYLALSHIFQQWFSQQFHCTTEGPRTAAFLPRFLKGAISPLVYRHAYFCFSTLFCSLLLSSRPLASDLSQHMPFVSLSLFPLGSDSFLYCQDTNVNGMPDGQKLVFCLSSGLMT